MMISKRILIAAFCTMLAAGANSTLAGEETSPQPAEVKGDPYTLDTCPVTGEKLGSMGDPLVKQIDGREVRFCCGGCVGKFEAKKDEYFKKIDEALIKQQLPYYPLKTCVVTGEPLVENSEDIAINHVFKNRLVRLCCRGFVSEFEKNQAAHLKKLDTAVIRQQREHYPLDTCVVAGGKLGSMGEPVELVVGNRLVRLCCAGCKPKIETNPAQYLAMIDAAWKKSGQLPGSTGGHEDHSSHDNEEHGDGHGHDH